MLNSKVLQAAAAACVSVRPHRLCTAAERFIRLCGDHGNADANFFLGMVRRSCLFQFLVYNSTCTHIVLEHDALESSDRAGGTMVIAASLS